MNGASSHPSAEQVAIFTMPVFGAVVSALTNWLALLIIFRPLHPHRICGVTVQARGASTAQRLEA